MKAKRWICLTTTILLIEMFLFALPVDAGRKVKSLGDINGDGIKEIAIEAETCGSSCYTRVTIKSGNKVILQLDDDMVLAGDTGDGYVILGRQVVVWRGDWDNESSKWKPHFYDLFWYRWDKARGKYVVAREGFTRRAYNYFQDKTGTQRKLRSLAKNPTQDHMVFSRTSTFAQDAGRFAVSQYHKQLISIRAEGLYDGPARSYLVVMGKGKNYEAVYVIINRQGRFSIEPSGD